MRIPKDSKNSKVFQTIGLRGWYPAWRGGWRVVRKTLEFLEFFGIYMVLAPSASEFLELLGIYSISGGLYLQILVNTQNF